ncbi:MAG: hypothetical protein JNL74_07165, partial [Fibrobacteres bacterium]|nr:hypothetical protein [Fibrobacterota bacterium]
MNRFAVSRGVALMLISNFAFCAMALLIRSAEVDPKVSSFFRFAVGLAVLGAGAMLGLLSLKFVSRKALFFRGLFGGAAT